jgi:hypothetical protein
VSETFSLATSLLGQNVTVKLAEHVIARGKLLAFSDAGEAAVQDEMGFVHHCWPMLDISPIDAS